MARYEDCEDGLRELHRLAAAGLNDSEEADLVRDSLDLPWGGLTEEERERLQAFSASLER